MAYIGQTRAANLIAELNSYGFGEMTVREEFPPRRFPWVFDNGAFKDFTAKREFQSAKYQKALDKMILRPDVRPDFVVVPDIVAGGLQSLRFSESWLPRLRWLDVPLYLVVQDGMTPDDVRSALTPYQGIFVGGSLPWKLKTAPMWTRLAHEYGRKCHVGRMGTRDRVRAAWRWGVDSIDSCLPLWSRENLRRFLSGFSEHSNMEFAGVA